MSDTTTVQTLIDILKTYPLNRRVFINGYDDARAARVSHDYTKDYDEPHAMNIQIENEEVDY